MTSATRDLTAAWDICADLYCRAARPPLAAPTRAQFERELLFCLLGGFGVSFELALSATERIGELEPFGEWWTEGEIAERIGSELSLQQFEPRTVGGALRRYRFPTRKANLIVGARRWLIEQGPLYQTLSLIGCERERRRILCACPGLGNKTASWLLRNVGLASRLAILDVHVVRALHAAGRISGEVLPRDYEAVEEAFVEWCDHLGAPPAAFDLFVWEWQRGSLMARA
jgi:N-glycosylase/DNA lyase